MDHELDFPSSIMIDIPYILVSHDYHKLNALSIIMIDAPSLW